jgi:hypothetical protein
MNLTATGNGGVGIVFQEEDGGDLHVSGIDVRTSGNDDGETGLELDHEDAGKGTLSLIGGAIEDGLETEDVTVFD